MSVPKGLVESLNEEQLECVTASLGNMLILAGAGTGKTRVLVSRIAYLLEVEMIQSRQIMALTFTNKAAGELKERVHKAIVNSDIKNLWVGTFHSICLKILRNYAHLAGISANFTVINREEQERLIKGIIKSSERYTDDEVFKPAHVSWQISSWKDDAMRPDRLQSALLTGKYGFLHSDEQTQDLIDIYRRYEQICKEQSIVDFSEIILKTVEIIEDNADVMMLLHRRFKEILVDEFQDTSALQYKLIRLLCAPSSHVTLVGDDDQSIYSWRGADINNIRRFVDNYPDVAVKKLSLNYRSSNQILEMANVLIANNEYRFESKVLSGFKGDGSKIGIYKCQDEWEEARTVVALISKYVSKDNMSLSDITVLYRNNSQSRILEQALMSNGIPFVVYGGLRFFEREEILNVIAYLKLALNAMDDNALTRIINVPSRKIGPVVVGKLRAIAKERGCSLYEACKVIVNCVKEDARLYKDLKTLAKKIEPFVDLIERLKVDLDSSLRTGVDNLLTSSGLIDYYRQKDEKDKKGAADNQKHKNLEEFAIYVEEFEKTQYSEHKEEYINLDGTPISPLLALISNISLVATGDLDEKGRESAGLNGGSVCLMTMHASKGLEFKTVFIIGFEKNIIPTRHAVAEDNIDEERRLAYVAITRAKDRLNISYATTRRAFVDGYVAQAPAGASLFLHEVVDTYKEKGTAKPYQMYRLDG